MIEAEKSRQGEEESSQAASTSARPGKEMPNDTGGDAETRDLAKSIAEVAESPSTTLSSSNEARGMEAETPFEMRESRVPSSRFGRLWQYGGLATSMAFGAVGESFRRFAGGIMQRERRGDLDRLD